MIRHTKPSEKQKLQETEEAIESSSTNMEWGKHIPLQVADEVVRKRETETETGRGREKERI